MAVDPLTLHIVNYPDPALRRTAEPLPEVNAEVREVARRMIQLMREARGIGLAAPQVGLAWRLFVADVPAADDPDAPPEPIEPGAAASTDGPVVYINPRLSDFSRDLVPMEEGCLSLPDIRGDVRRPIHATITATGLDGAEFTHRAGGLLARCWQHESDHLDGVLIIDKMTQRSKLKNRAAVRELERGARPL